MAAFSTVPRRLKTSCVTNFYPIHFQSKGLLQIHIFHCYFYDVDADEAIKPREETELKRRIFEAPRQEGRQRDVEDALGIRGLEFGGDCAAGLRSSSAMSGAFDPKSLQKPPELVVDDVDRYEANYSGDWMPCVIRKILENDVVLVELYAPGSFWSEMLNRSGPFRVAVENLRPRQWEVYRGEVLKVPDHEILTLHTGQHLWVRARGPGHDEPAGRLSIGLGAGVRCEGGTVENEGLVESITTLAHPQYGPRRYKVEIESIKTLLVDCMEGVPDLPSEERSVVLQCFTWIFERAYRHMQMRTLGGRGWYLAEEGETYPKQQEGEQGRLVPPRVFLYRGFAATAVQVASGPCLKVDLSVRMIQGQTALAKLNFFRDLLIQRHQSAGQGPPTKDETEAFLQLQMVGRTCMTRHNHIHYRISKVCIDMDPVSSTFPFEDGEISYMEYFQRRHGISLQRRQPMLHCPFRGKHELYLPAELAFLTGLDDDWKADREFAQELWRGLRHDPVEHWRMQQRLTNGLASAEEGAALREWGVAVAQEPLRAKMGELEHEPVYFSRASEEFFRRALLPPPELEVPTTRQGFDRRPWPEVWGRAPLRLDRWLLFCSSRPEEKRFVEKFLQELAPLAGEILDADMGQNRIVIGPPEVVGIAGNTPGSWVEFVQSYRPPWPRETARFALVVIPEKVRRRDQYYYQLKELFSFQPGWCQLPSQMLLSSTLQRTSQRQQIWRNVLQQMLIKQGAWLWVVSPLPYRGRAVMVVGIDACRQSKESASVQTLCGSFNPYFTCYHTTWRATDAKVSEAPGVLMREAMLKFFEQNRRLPDTVVVYRAGVSESQEATMLENEVHNSNGGLLEAMNSAAAEVRLPAAEVARWRERLEFAYILVRRGTNARFRTETFENLPSGSYIDDCVVASREADASQRFDFYMVSQTYVIGTAKPTLYSVLYSTLSLSRYEVMQLSYRLCGVYMTFSGMVSVPAPLKYAAKLLSLLTKCEAAPPQPTGEARAWLSKLFFV